MARKFVSFSTSASVSLMGSGYKDEHLIIVLPWFGERDKWCYATQVSHGVVQQKFQILN